jgi:hypothetical protein
MNFRFFKKLCFFLLAFSASAAFAQDQGYPVNGVHLAFWIPKAKPTIYDIGAYLQELETKTPTLMMSYLDAEAACPASTRYYADLQNRILTANGLADLKETILLRTLFFCESLKTTIADYRLGELIYHGRWLQGNFFYHPIGDQLWLSSSALPYFGSDDEIAYIVSHELAHMLFRHGEDFAERGLIPTSERASLEAQADRYGTILMWNAGFHPGAAREALSHALSYYHFETANLARRIELWTRQNFQPQPHGTFLQRQRRINRILNYTNLKDSRYVARKSPALQAAQQEIRDLRPVLNSTAHTRHVNP